MPPPDPQITPLSTIERLKRSTGRLAEHADATRQEKTRRDGLIVRAIDEGFGFGVTARAAGLSPARIAAIVGERSE